jgi:hypothetical protein
MLTNTMLVLAFLGISCLLASVGSLIWAIVRSFRRRRSRWHYVASCGFFISTVIVGLCTPTPKVRGAGTSARPVSEVRVESSPRRSILATAQPTEAPSLPPQAPPSPEQTDSPDMQKFRDDWMDITERAASALSSANAANVALRNSDPIAASGKLKDCEEAASGISDAGYNLPLDLENDKDSSLLEAVKSVGDGLGYGCKSMRAFLDTGAPSDGADAKASLASVPDAMYKAQYLADQKYKAMGGYGVILDFKSAINDR